MNRDEVTLQPIETDHTDSVSRFLQENLNRRVPPESWRAILDPPWSVSAPNHGFMLTVAGDVVGAYVAVYSERENHGRAVAVCNLAAYCVLEPYRAHGFRLLRALIRQRGYVFTDLSPSGNVVKLNERVGFVRLDPTTHLTLNVPAPPRHGTRVSDDPAIVGATLSGRDVAVFQDHRSAPATRHVVVTARDDYAYLMVRKDRRKGLPLFATPLHVSGDRGLLETAWPQVRTLLLRRYGALATLAETQVLGFTPPLGVALSHPRPRMYRGTDLPADQIDYLYSELTLLEW